MIWFILGLFVGTIIGILIMFLMIMAKKMDK